MLTFKGKAFQVKPLRPQVASIIKLLEKSKTGQLFTQEDICKALKIQRSTMAQFGAKFCPELTKYSTIWRRSKFFGKPATIKLLVDEIKATKV